MFNFISELKSKYQNIIISLSALNEKVESINAHLLNLEQEKANSGIVNQPVVNEKDADFYKKEILEPISYKSDSLINKVDDIRNRMEFIREEMMFEMRLKTNTLTDKKDSQSIEKKVLSSNKFENLGWRKINLGCGHIQPEGFINVDARELPGVDIISGADDLLFEDNVLDEIYAAHLIEHFTELELSREIFPHWLTKIKPGGQLRLVTPDADSMIADYVAGTMSFEDLRKVTYGAQDYEGDFHYTMFSVNSLHDLLKNAGFETFQLIENNRKNGLCREMEIIATKAEAK